MVFDSFALMVRAALVAGALSLVLAGCGRRGPLEAPPDPAAPQQKAQVKAADADDEEEESASILPSPTPTPAKKRSRAYKIPTEPFFLDPLL